MKTILLILKFIILAGIILILLFPVWLMIMNSFVELKAFLRMPPRIIQPELSLVNYQKLFALPYLPKWLLNTLILASSIIIMGIISNGAAGYVFAFANHKILTIIFWVMMTPLFVTRYVLIISQFIIVGKLMMSGLMASIIMVIFWPSGIFLFRNYFKSIPISLLEIARIDGAHEWTILFKIVLPLSKPIIGMTIVFLGMAALGDYLWQLLNLQDDNIRTYLVGLMSQALNLNTMRNIGYELATGTMLFLPYLVLFSLSSKYFISGLTGGALKE